jgi:hypothetical protein
LFPVTDARAVACPPFAVDADARTVVPVFVVVVVFGVVEAVVVFGVVEVVVVGVVDVVDLL